MLVRFLERKNHTESVQMEVEGIIENKSVPYSPKNQLDCRGLAIYVFCAMTGVSLHELDFEDNETKRLVHCGYHYMNNPVYVVEAIHEGRSKK